MISISITGRLSLFSMTLKWLNFQCLVFKIIISAILFFPYVFADEEEKKALM